jgi:hypothetical protein
MNDPVHAMERIQEFITQESVGVGHDTVTVVPFPLLFLRIHDGSGGKTLDGYVRRRYDWVWDGVRGPCRLYGHLDYMRAVPRGQSASRREHQGSNVKTMGIV